MSDLCLSCRHRRAADAAAKQRIMAPAPGGKSLDALVGIQTQFAGEVNTEQLAYERTGGGQMNRRPVLHDWCAAQSEVEPETQKGTYYFCDWLTEDSCSYLRCLDVLEGCPRCRGENGPCLRLEPAVARADTAETAAGRADVPVAAPGSGEAAWALPLGAAFDLHPVRGGRSLGSNSFSMDFELTPSAEQPAIRGKGLQQTYLLFGGPGAGKTYYFKYLLSSLLRHRRRPGCLLLDPKGVLTPWLTELLESIERGDDLTVLATNSGASPFNVLGDDLAPEELGRLLSEVVLAGVSGIDEGWQVLVGDLLESAAVVIAADPEPDTHLTAASLLRDVLYRRTYRYRDDKRVREYPIVIRARRVARERGLGVDVRIACDRIADWFASTEDRQRRFVRQIIERTLGELMSPDWAHLSGTERNSLYSEIINQGRVVTVAVGQSSPAFQRSMSSLVKSLFQQAVLADLSRRDRDSTSDSKPKPKPFFILACDEYAQAITEGETGLVSDSRFYSLSREAGCLSLLALQSVATGRSRFPAAMHDRWDGILGNVTVKFFMRLNDVETAELGSALAGTQHSFVHVATQERSAAGLSASEGVTLVEHPRVPPWYLTNRMAQGQALVHGTLDGESVPTSLFIRVPKWD